MKILLTTLNSKFVHTNLALRYLYFGINREFDTELKEFTINEELFKVLAGITESNADVIAFSCYIWNIEYIIKIIKIIKQVRPNIIVILGGPEVSHDAEHLMNLYNFIDYVVLGEAEQTFPRLISFISNSLQSTCNINGVAYRDKNGCAKIKGQPSILNDLALVPSPFLEDLTEYKQRVVYFESTRGCPYNCSYCLSSTTKGVRFFPIERTKDELKRLIDANVKQVKFVDRTFNCNKNRAMDIWRFLLENKKETTFHFEISGHLLDQEMIDFLVKVPKGFFQFEIGVQSTHDQTIEAINRKTDFSKLSNVVKILKEKGNIHLHLDLIAGLPYESYQRFGESFDDLYKLKPHMLQLGFLKLLKGSNIREQREVHLYKYTNNPPYEILENKYITFNEVISLKRIEEIVETYKNSFRFERSFDYIINNFYKRPFIFFEELSHYWLLNGHFDRKVGTEETYDILASFYQDKEWEKQEKFIEILKLDYIINCFGARRRCWQKKYTVDDMKNVLHKILSDQEFIKNYIPHLAELSMGNRLKSLHFEIFSSDIIDYNSEEPIIVLFERNGRRNKIIYLKVQTSYFNSKNIYEI